MTRERQTAHDLPGNPERGARGARLTGCQTSFPASRQAIAKRRPIKKSTPPGGGASGIPRRDSGFPPTPAHAIDTRETPPKGVARDHRKETPTHA